MKSGKILVLNKSFFPIRIENVQQTFVNMMKDTYHGLDIEFDVDDDGNLQHDKISSMIIVKDFADWVKLDVRPYDDYIMTVKGPIRMPYIVICAKYNKIRFPKVQFPTNKNIFRRDNYTCCYTGKKLQKHELSVDHILPVSKGGKNTWENLVTCDREVNSRKGNKTPEQAGLKLLMRPHKPKNGLVFEVLKEEWRPFIEPLTK